MKRKALGKGLSSLIPQHVAQVMAPAVQVQQPEAAAGPLEIDLDLLEPNPFQPRGSFPAEELAELVASIRRHGLLQPVLVRSHGERYQIIVGERRVRAAQNAGLMRIPAVLRSVTDNEMAELALVENVQREDLNPMDEARAYRDLMARLDVTQGAVAERVGKDRSTVANSLRLLNLADSIQSSIENGSLSPGHGRALLAAPEELRQNLARRILRDGLSVRQVEKLASASKPAQKAKPVLAAVADPNTRQAEERMTQALATKVQIRRKGKGGNVEIAFHDEEELERIFESIVGA